MHPDEIQIALKLPQELQAEVQTQWLRLMEIAVWGELKSINLGSLAKMRKRLLDFGEKWRSIFNNRDWLPQPREQLKNALGSSANLRDSLLMLERVSQDIQGGKDYPEFERLLISLHKAVVGPLHEKETTWATLLDKVNAQAINDDDN